MAAIEANEIYHMVELDEKPEAGRWANVTSMYEIVSACVETNSYSTELEEGAGAAPVGSSPPGRVYDKEMM